MTAIITTGVEFPDDGVQQTAVRSDFIWIYRGAIVNIPAGFQLCNGTNGTPDLRNRMIICAGDSYAVGATGGSASVTLTAPQLPIHNHVASGTDESSTDGSHNHSPRSTGTEPNHSHPFAGGIRTPGPVTSSGSGASFGTISSSGSGGSHSHPSSVGTGGAHTHPLSVTIGPTGGGGSHNNMPPYYALAFIMRV